MGHTHIQMDSGPETQSGINAMGQSRMSKGVVMSGSSACTNELSYTRSKRLCGVYAYRSRR